MGDEGGYGAILAERPVRRLLLASLSGRVAFSMLPLGFVLFAAAATGSTATAGALVAAFTAASALAPLRGRIVDRRGPPALAAFAVGCSAGIAGLVVAAAAGAPSAVLVLVSAAAGLALPPLGAFTRAVWGLALRESRGALQRVYALDSAGEEAALVVAPLAVGVIVAVASPDAALLVAAAGLLVGTVAAGRSGLAAGVGASRAVPRAGPARLPPAFWLVVASLVPPAAALGAIDVAVPAAARERGHTTSAGVLLAAMAAGTVAGSLLAGRREWRWRPERRVIALELVMGVTVAGAAAVAARLELLGLALVAPGAALGALFATLYVLVDRLAPDGSGTRTFAWLVTANNGGIALGAVVGGALSEASGPAAGLWFAAVCALAGAVPAVGAAAMSARADERAQTSGASGVPSGGSRTATRQGNGETREGS